MASSNRHWPSMFKSKPCNQWQHDINQSLIASACHRSPYTSPGCEERSPEPKPRWNPRPEQIRILEAIFNSGMVNPPRDEIRKIRAQLQEYGQVGDANVFYWFQNRKSRSKHKLRHHHKHNNINKPSNSNSNTNTNSTNNNNKTSSSEKSSSASPTDLPLMAMAVSSTEDNNNNSNNITIHNNNQSSFVDDYQLLLGFGNQNQNHHGIYGNSSGNLGLMVDEEPQLPTGLFLGELMNSVKKSDADEIVNSDKINNLLPSLIVRDHHHHHHHHDVVSSSALHEQSVSPPVLIPQLLQGNDGTSEEGSGSMVTGKSTVFINDVAFDVPLGPFNVREAFGDDAVLLNSYGHPILTDQWGLTLHSLTHGSFYYLI